MGKGNKKRFLENLQRIDAIQKDIQKERKKIIVQCAHQNEDGKLKINPVDDEGTYECKYCHARFNMKLMKTAMIEEAVAVLHDAIQQIRCHSDIDRDEKYIRLLGELDFNIQEVPDFYDKVVLAYGKGGKRNKNKHRHDRGEENFGGYGGGGSFLGGGKRKK